MTAIATLAWAAIGLPLETITVAMAIDTAAIIILGVLE